MSNLDKVRAGAVESVQNSDAFIQLTLKDGTPMFRALIPDRFPIDLVLRMIAETRARLDSVEKVMRKQKSAAIVSAPRGFDPKKIH